MPSKLGSTPAKCSAVRTGILIALNTAAAALPGGLKMLFLWNCPHLAAADHLPPSVEELVLTGCTGRSAEVVAQVERALPKRRIYRL